MCFLHSMAEYRKGKRNRMKAPSFLPSQVHERREARRKALLSTMLRGIWLRFAIIIAELLGFIYWHSSSLLLDGLSSFLDIGVSLLLMLCVFLADKPPDRHHPLGHGRFEPIAGFQLGVFLAIVGGYLGIQQSISMLEGSMTARSINAHCWVIPALAVVTLEIAYRHLKTVAKQQNSPSLLADAIHYRIDSLGSLFALFALSFGAFFPEYSVFFDHMGALSIAILMLITGLKAAWKNIHPLLDRTPDAAYFEKVRHAALLVDQVLATEKIRIQSYGPDAQVSIDIEVDPTLTVSEAHVIAKNVRLEVQKAWPAVRDVIVHVEPASN